MSEIVNKVAHSALVTFDLEAHYPEGKRVLFDYTSWLEGGLVLREKSFREQVKTFDWSQFANQYVALWCTEDAILPAWASMLITTQLALHAKRVVAGTLNDLERTLFLEVIADLDLTPFSNKAVMVKGCSHKRIPQDAYLQLIQKLQPVAKSLFYGEACASVPLFKKQSS